MARALKPAGATDRHRRSAIVVAALVAVVLLGGAVGVWLAMEGGTPWGVAR